MAAEEISRYALRGVAAVASALAAEVYSLEILREKIETYPDNYTRFVVLSEKLTPPEGPADKASVCFTLPHTPGALSHILTVLSFYDMNLTRIQSLPIPGEKWQYFFYADICFSDYNRWQQALTAVRPLIKDLDILGEYKAVGV
jgi:prephenate dehydratase